MKCSSIFLLLFLLGGCNSSVGSFEGDIWDIKSDAVLVECSSTVNRDVDGDMASVAYLCNVEVTEDTVITNVNSNQISIEDLKEGQFVQVVLSEETDISKRNRDVTAAEINVLN